MKRCHVRLPHIFHHTNNFLNLCVAFFHSQTMDEPTRQSHQRRLESWVEDNIRECSRMGTTGYLLPGPEQVDARDIHPANNGIKDSVVGDGNIFEFNNHVTRWQNATENGNIVDLLTLDISWKSVVNLAAQSCRNANVCDRVLELLPDDLLHGQIIRMGEHRYTMAEVAAASSNHVFTQSFVDRCRASNTTTQLGANGRYTVPGRLNPLLISVIRTSVKVVDVIAANPQFFGDPEDGGPASPMNALHHVCLKGVGLKIIKTVKENMPRNIHNGPHLMMDYTNLDYGAGVHFLSYANIGAIRDGDRGSAQVAERIRRPRQNNPVAPAQQNPPAQILPAPAQQNPPAQIPPVPVNPPANSDDEDMEEASDEASDSDNRSAPGEDHDSSSDYTGDESEARSERGTIRPRDGGASGTPRAVRQRVSPDRPTGATYEHPELPRL